VVLQDRPGLRAAVVIPGGIAFENRHPELALRLGGRRWRRGQACLRERKRQESQGWKSRRPTLSCPFHLWRAFSYHPRRSDGRLGRFLFPVPGSRAEGT
jgi:hypothetical protein